MSMRQGLYGLNEPAMPTRPPSLLRKIVKILMIIGTVIFVSLMTLHLVGGTSEYLHKTVERFLSDSTGYTTKVGKLNAVSFYPLIGIDMEDVKLEGADQAVVARFTHVNFSTSFWSASSGSSFHSFDVRDGVVSPGIVSPGRIEIERFYISVEDTERPRLTFKGSYDRKPLDFNADLAIVPGLFGNRYLTFADPAPFTVRAGDIHAEGNILTDFTGRSMEVSTLSAGPGLKPITMKIALVNEGFSTGAKGALQSGDSKADYNFSFSHSGKQKHIQGSVKADRFDLDDLLKKGGLLDSQKAIKTFYRAGTRPEETDFNYLDLDVTIEAAHLLRDGMELGAVQAKLVTRDGHLVFEDVKATPEGSKNLNALLPLLKDATLK